MPDYARQAQLESRLMREFLPDDRPPLNECIWVETVLSPPSPEGIRRLQEIQAHYGACHVTTGIAVRDDACGIYVRGDVLERAENPLWTHLSKP